MSSGSRAGGDSWGRGGVALELEARALLWLAAVFLASRGIFFALGVRFDASTLNNYWQYLDPRLLQEDLLRSVFYLHSQPPLFNVFLGLVLKLSPVEPAHAFHGLYLAAGLVCQLATFLLMRALGVGRAVAGILSTILVIRPSFILFENWLMYDVPVTALMCLAALALARFAQTGSALYAHAFCITLLLICSSRSLFHLLYFVATLALLAGIARGYRRRVLLRSAIVPLALLTLLYAKGFLVFGHFGPSTWIGMNLTRIATAALTVQDLETLHRQGVISATATVPPFSALEAYDPSIFSPPRYPDVPALANRIKSTGGVNYNHEAYIDVSSRYMTDALQIIRHRPLVYLHGVAKAWYNYFKPQTEISHVSVNTDRLGGYTTFGATMLHGRLPITVDYGGEKKPIYLFSFLGIPLLTLFALYLAWRAKPMDSSRLVLAFTVLTVIYVAILGNSLEVWENQRFRFYTDPFFAVFLGLMIERVLRGRPPARGSQVG